MRDAGYLIKELVTSRPGIPTGLLNKADCVTWRLHNSDPADQGFALGLRPTFGLYHWAVSASADLTIMQPQHMETL